MLRVWHERKASVNSEVANAEHEREAIQQKLDRLDDAFLYPKSIDLEHLRTATGSASRGTHAGEIDRHGFKIEEFDVEGILAFAERLLPRASDLWIQASLEQRQRLQRLFFPDGVAFSGKAFDRTVVTSSLFEYLRPLDGSNRQLEPTDPLAGLGSGIARSRLKRSSERERPSPLPPSPRSGAWPPAVDALDDSDRPFNPRSCRGCAGLPVQRGARRRNSVNKFNTNVT